MPATDALECRFVGKEASGMWSAGGENASGGHRLDGKRGDGHESNKEKTKR